MNSIIRIILILIIIPFLTACEQGSPAVFTPTSMPTPDIDPFYKSNGGGEPRSAGYWLSWNSCTQDNKAEVAAANGGREAGWVILDDLIENPGILLGELSVTSCLMGVNLLLGQDITGSNPAGDPAYILAGELLTAQLNLAVGAEYCPAVDEAVKAGQLLLISRGFDGTGTYFELMESSTERETAEILVEQLAEYNAGILCK
jgi:hypothetical protein